MFQDHLKYLPSYYICSDVEILLDKSELKTDVL